MDFLEDCFLQGVEVSNAVQSTKLKGKCVMISGVNKRFFPLVSKNIL